MRFYMLPAVQGETTCINFDHVAYVRLGAKTIELHFMGVEAPMVITKSAATLALVYPPGIGVIVPGERYDERAKPMLDYLTMFERAANKFPGFDSEIQGIYREIATDGAISFHTYVVQENIS